MLNKDINSRFEDWLLNPRETLDFEVKQWLDLDEPEAQGLLAKALIALENHGGGFLLLGYREENGTLVPDVNRPNSLDAYSTDALNAIVKKRAEPAFHVEVTLQAHPGTAETYPLVRVPGTSRVPVRSDSATPAGSLRQHIYYIRAPGPESRAPLSAAEWDALIRRAVMNQRQEILDLLRDLSPTGALIGSNPPPAESALLEKFINEASERWLTLNVGLPQDHPGRISLGHFRFAARIVGTVKPLSAQELLDANQRARRYTGWSAFVVLHKEAERPRLVDGVIEAWLAAEDYVDVGHADFWRIDPKGNFFLLRGYQEDSTGDRATFGTPGTVLEVTLPVWRLGEFLLRVADLADVMFEPEYQIVVDCEWTGLAGRRLAVHNMRRMLAGTYKSAAESVETKGQFPQRAIRDLLPETVRTLTAPLYEHFDFFKPPDAFYKEELDEMMKNRF